MARYLEAAAETLPEVVYAMYNGCVLVGMSGTHLRVSLGVGSSLAKVAPTDGASDRARWVFVMGLEGQQLLVDVNTAADRVVGWVVRDDFRPSP